VYVNPAVSEFGAIANETESTPPEKETDKGLLEEVERLRPPFGHDQMATIADVAFTVALTSMRSPILYLVFIMSNKMVGSG